MAGLHSLWEIAPTMKISDKKSFVAESDQNDIIIWTNVFAKKSNSVFLTNNLNNFSKIPIRDMFLLREHERE